MRCIKGVIKATLRVVGYHSEFLLFNTLNQVELTCERIETVNHLEDAVLNEHILIKVWEVNGAEIASVSPEWLCSCEVVINLASRSVIESASKEHVSGETKAVGQVDTALLK